MTYRLISLIEPAPTGFTFTPVIGRKDVLRRPFALLAENPASAEDALEPFGAGAVGIMVTSGEKLEWQRRVRMLYHLTVPSGWFAQLEPLVLPYLELLDNWHCTEMAQSNLQLNLSRAIEDSTRQQNEFSVIKENLLNELSERKRVASELTSTRSHLAATLDAMPDLLFEVGKDGCIFDYHSPRTELLALPPERFLHRRMGEVLPPDVAEVCEAAIIEAHQNGTSTGRQYELNLSHGRYWFELSVSSKEVSEGAEQRFIMLARDITPRKTAELELKKKNADIEQFIYTVSHDLRSPLVTVKAFLGYLEQDMEEGNRLRFAQDLQYIHAAADKMKLLLDELLELSRIDRSEPVPVQTSLLEIVHEVLDVMAGIINDHNLQVEIPKNDVMLIGDRSRLFQIWQNLVENAVKYRYGNDLPLVRIGACQSDGEMRFYVRDNGIGIEPQYHEQVFNLFEKLDARTPGAGMGLAIVRRVVEKCGGRIWVESAGHGEGTCFWFTLPEAAAGKELVVVCDCKEEEIYGL